MLVSFQLMYGIKSIVGFDAEDRDERPVSVDNTPPYHLASPCYVSEAETACQKWGARRS